MLKYLMLTLVVTLGVSAKNCRPDSCPSDGDVLLPDPSDCSKFISCVNGAAIERKCRRGQLFDKTLLTCVSQKRAKCEKCDVSSEESDELSIDSIIQSPPKIQTREQHTRIPLNNISQRCIENSITKVICPEDIGDDRLMPHPDDCRLFYVCVEIGKEPICRDCPDNLHFNPVKKVCDHSNVAGCRSHIAIPLPHEIPKENSDVNEIANSNMFEQCEQLNSDNADLRPDPKDCGKYYVCDWGKLIPMICPAGLHFSAQLKVCDLPQNVRCQIENSTATHEIEAEPKKEDSAEDNNKSSAEKDNSEEEKNKPVDNDNNSSENSSDKKDNSAEKSNESLERKDDSAEESNNSSNKKDDSIDDQKEDDSKEEDKKCSKKSGKKCTKKNSKNLTREKNKKTDKKENSSEEKDVSSEKNDNSSEEKGDSRHNVSDEM